MFITDFAKANGSSISAAGVLTRMAVLTIKKRYRPRLSQARDSGVWSFLRRFMYTNSHRHRQRYQRTGLE
jgi:hypothetical protein